MQVRLQAPHPRRSVMWELALGFFAYIKTIIHSSIYHHPVLSSQGHFCDSGEAPPPMSWRPGWRVQLPHRVEHNFPFHVQHTTSTHNSIRISLHNYFVPSLLTLPSSHSTAWSTSPGMPWCLSLFLGQKRGPLGRSH